MNLKNKRVLITAGPTWVALDSVRVISNTATGETGILLAEKFRKTGARVTLVLGPSDAEIKKNGIRVLRFRFFDELKELIGKELSGRAYDVIIHSAAVSDYRSKKAYGRKMSSALKQWKIVLVPTPKIIDLIRKAAPSACLVGFKFEPRSGREALLREALKLAKRSKLDVAVANTAGKNGYEAYVVYQGKTRGPFFKKNSLAGDLLSVLREEI